MIICLFLTDVNFYQKQKEYKNVVDVILSNTTILVKTRVFDPLIYTREAKYQSEQIVSFDLYLFNYPMNGVPMGCK